MFSPELTPVHHNINNTDTCMKLQVTQSLYLRQTS